MLVVYEAWTVAAPPVGLDAIVYVPLTEGFAGGTVKMDTAFATPAVKRSHVLVKPPHTITLSDASRSMAWRLRGVVMELIDRQRFEALS